MEDLRLVDPSIHLEPTMTSLVSGRMKSGSRVEISQPDRGPSPDQSKAPAFAATNGEQGANMYWYPQRQRMESNVRDPEKSVEPMTSRLLRKYTWPTLGAGV